MFGEITYYLPIVIRVGAVVMICAILYDYFKRKWANALVDALKSAGAESIGTAVGTDELEKSIKNVRLIIKILLSSEMSSLRRVIKCVSVERENTKNGKKRSEKLTGSEKWYLKMPELSEEDENQKTSYSMPYVLRDGGERSTAKIVIGIIVVILFSELIIYFLPQIISFFSGVSNFGND